MPLRSTRTTSKAKTTKKANPLFIQSDDEADQENPVQEEETLRSSFEERPKRPVRKSTKTVKKPRSRSTKQPVVVVDDDSDEDIFQGFKAKT